MGKSRGKPKNIEFNLTEIIEPTTYEQALNSPQSNEWQEAMDDEIRSLEDRGTWEIVEKTDDYNCVGSKWVYKIKTDPEGNVVKFKARLVAQGFKQIKYTDYCDTYAPVANIETIRLLLAMGISKGWHIHHLDVKCAYLYGELKENVYMRLPQGYSVMNNKVAKLKRPIYGLKQSGRNWNNTIDKFLIDIGFHRMKSNNCVYVYRCELILQ